MSASRDHSEEEGLVRSPDVIDNQRYERQKYFLSRNKFLISIVYLFFAATTIHSTLSHRRQSLSIDTRTKRSTRNIRMKENTKTNTTSTNVKLEIQEDARIIAKANTTKAKAITKKKNITSICAKLVVTTELKHQEKTTQEEASQLHQKNRANPIVTGNWKKIYAIVCSPDAARKIITRLVGGKMSFMIERKSTVVITTQSQSENRLKTTMRTTSSRVVRGNTAAIIQSTLKWKHEERNSSRSIATK